jgi:tetratricopeptide (TPR) repeat protein
MARVTVDERLRMGAMSNWSTLRSRIAGKWQVPLLLISAIALAGSLYKLRPPATAMSLSDAADYLNTLVDGGMYDRALEIAEALLQRHAEAEAELGPIHLVLARSRYGEAERLGSRTETVGKQIVADYQRAGSLGEAFKPIDLVQLGHALEWMGRFGSAVSVYQKALDQGVDEPFPLRRRTIELSRDHELVDAVELNDLLGAFLSDLPDHRLDLRLWAIEEKLFALEGMNRLEEGATLLARHNEQFQGSDLRDRFEYLEALLLHKSGYYDEAEIRLRTILNRAEPHSDVRAMVGWLLGRVVMYDDGPKRPQEAITFFTEVLRHDAAGPYGMASRIGLAESLTMLHRYEEAALEYEVVIGDLPDQPNNRLVHADSLRASLGVAAEQARQEGMLEAAVSFARLAVSLIDDDDVEQATFTLQQLARMQELLAEDLLRRAELRRDEEPGDPTISDWSYLARALLSEAASVYGEMARINVLHDRRAAEASWLAAELAARAGELERAAQLFQAFIHERPSNALVPRGLIRIGRLRQAQGKLEAAIEAFQQCYRQFPRSMDGASALIPLAECYLAKGSDGFDLAEKTLRIVLEESEVFTPDAPEFADALFLLGEARVRKGDLEKAIAALEEALARYPEDRRGWRARYLLADAYRQSALALKNEATTARTTAEIERLRGALDQRLAEARLRFREVISEFEARDPSVLTRLERLYLRHAYLFEADCYFETRDYRRALRLYEEAAGLYRDHPSGLAAYVRIIHCHVFLGQSAEARAALSRALVVADTVPEEAFDQSVSPESRADWKRYFNWLGSSDLF